MNIIKTKSRYCGFCSGVKRAIKMAENAALDQKVYTLGPIIHNPQVVEKLEKKGIIPITSIDEIDANGTILIRSHGVTEESENELKERGLVIIDATCPKVKRAHRICKELADEYEKIIIIGVDSHPEVKGILSRSNGKGLTISSVEDADKLEESESVGVIAQTTFRKEKFFDIVSKIVRKSKVVKIHNTICEETVSRQNELKDIAEEVELLIVIGGKNSSNTKRLYEMGSEIRETYLIEGPDEIDPLWFEGKSTIGITTGASTPLDIVQEVEEKIDLLIDKKNKIKKVERV